MEEVGRKQLLLVLNINVLYCTGVLCVQDAEGPVDDDVDTVEPESGKH